MIRQAERTPYSPINYRHKVPSVPAVFKSSAPEYEGPHDAFWVHPRSLTGSMKVRTICTVSLTFGLPVKSVYPNQTASRCL